MTSCAARRTASARTSHEDGFALITTLLTLALLAAFSLVVLQQTISNTAASRKDQDWVSALAAAQAGIDDYVRRLNESNGAYFVWSTTNPDTGNPAMGPVSGPPNWADIQNADVLPDGVTTAPTRGRFHYDVDTSAYTGASAAPNGNIVVTSTGKVGSRTRTLRATVRRSGFLDFVYFTDLDTQDPLDYPVVAIPEMMSRAEATAKCPFYYQERKLRGCVEPAFSNDSLSGPVHSNDTMLICDNVTFKDAVTTMAAAVNGLTYRTTDPNCPSTAGTTFARAGDPKTVPRVNLPSTNLSLRAQTSAAASPRGCLYTGPTKIVVRGPQIKVSSPWTRTLTPGCPRDTFFNLPVNGVVYVARVPADNTTDDNSWRTGETPPTCPDNAANKNNVGYPIAGEKAGSWDYPCRAGDVFIEQESGNAANALNGRLTVAASNNLYITNHLDYASGSNSFLGLIAEQFIYLYHPIDSSNANLPLPGQTTPFTDARVKAALLSVNHAISLQNYLHGSSLGTLNITGAMTQKFRGVVRFRDAGGVQHGYTAKNYVYDQRLRYDAPPRFLNPTLNAFGAVRTAERKAAYS